MTQDKPCTKCGGPRTGNRSQCRACRAEYDRVRLSDPEKRERHRAYQRERNRVFFKTEEGRAFNRAHALKYKKDNPEKVRARWKAARAFPLKGVMCQRCQKSPATRRHHHDYSKPLDVELLCKPCNIIADREVRSGGL